MLMLAQYSIKIQAGNDFLGFYTNHSSNDRKGRGTLEVRFAKCEIR